jgi:prolyl-tRNA editing enzyme YbaK/EbsC (Cys-tRNA(Pro) deacylase)
MRHNAAMVGTLAWVPVTDRLDLVAASVAAALKDLAPADAMQEVRVAEIDPDLADTAAFCETYDVGLDVSANCVVVAAKRGGERTMAACMVLATARADVNGLVRRHLGARKVSFAPMDVATRESGMEYGGITPVGLPPDWPLLVDGVVAATDQVVVGSGVRRSKLLLPGRLLGQLPHAEVLDGLGQPLP